MHILNRETIEGLLNGVDLSSLISKGFIAYSSGQVVVPPIGELTFKDPPGDVHIKYGYIKGDKYYVIKIASGFWKNEEYGIPAVSPPAKISKSKLFSLKYSIP